MQAVRLLRTLMVVVLEKLLRHFSHLPEGGGQTNLQAFLVERAVQPLYIGILVRATRRADVGVDAQAEPKATECRGKMPQAVTAHPPAIAITGHTKRTPISAKEVGDGEHSRFPRENPPVPRLEARWTFRHPQN